MSAAVSESHLKMPPGFADAVHLTDSELQQHILLMAALKMFELGKVSSGKAAELAGLSRVGFLEKCGQYRVSIFNYDADELEQELESDLNTLKNSVYDCYQQHRAIDRAGKTGSSTRA